MIERVVGDAGGVAVGVAMPARRSVAGMRARGQARSGESGEAIEAVLAALRAELARAVVEQHERRIAVCAMQARSARRP